MITFNKTAQWCEDFTHEYMGEYLQGDYHIRTCIVPVERTPGATMVFIDAFEPDVMQPLSTVDDIVKSIKNIDILLTRRPELLTAFPDKARKFVYGTTWLKNPRTTKKEKSISFTMTSKRGDGKADGYNLRWSFLESVLNHKVDFALPFRFFDSSRFPVFTDYENTKEWLARLNEGKNSHQFIEDEKEPIFDSMFSIIIENQRHPNYLTEKLIDCVLSKSVPLYFGCPNIGDYFDTEGMIIIRDLEHLIEVVQNLTPEDYETRLPIMQKNLELAQDLARPLAERTIEAIKKAN